MSLSEHTERRQREANERRYARALAVADETGVADIATNRLLDELFPMSESVHPARIGAAPDGFVDNDWDGLS